MNKTVSRKLGVILLFSIYAVLLYLLSTSVIAVNVFVFYSILITSLGLTYSLIHLEKYPVQPVLVVLTVQFILYLIYKETTNIGNINELMLSIDMIFGGIFVIVGSKIGKAFTSILLPVQKYFHSIGLKFSIPVIAGIIGFLISYFLIKTEIAFILPLPLPLYG